MDNVKNILFDLGGVVIDIDVQRTVDALAKLFGMEGNVTPRDVLGQEVFLRYETGLISSSQFVASIRRLSGNGVNESDVIDAWNSMLVEIPERRVKTIERLKLQHKLYVLSNTNSLHVERFERMAPGYDHLSQLFDRMYFSHLIGSRKPDTTAFLSVVVHSGIVAEETLFVDDLADNIETARRLGFQTLHVSNGLDISDWFEQNWF
ncbi:HAD family hydrolase [Alkaliflexus imshenetskii]|uniref:HAD family hydrolase n=1 Tax=Alkaliflexus imshenetskii TaxID=286730 RepID=UPI0004B2252D|nr:HAD family phosphatase [Alkaliflexus imshenetskii]